MSNPMDKSFVVASSIAADLSTVQSISMDLYMSTLNAKVVTARSGDIGKTFQPLTDYALRLAGTTGTIVEDIAVVASKITRMSVTLLQSEEKGRAIKSAMEKHGAHNPAIIQIKKLDDLVQLETDHMMSDYISAMRMMLLNIEFLATEVQSIFCLAVNCRIEASHCKEFRSDFESIATDIEQAAERVSGVVSLCQSRIGNELSLR